MPALPVKLKVQPGLVSESASHSPAKKLPPKLVGMNLEPATPPHLTARIGQLWAHVRQTARVIASPKLILPATAMLGTGMTGDQSCCLLAGGVALLGIGLLVRASKKAAERERLDAELDAHITELVSQRQFRESIEVAQQTSYPRLALQTIGTWLLREFDSSHRPIDSGTMRAYFEANLALPENDCVYTLNEDVRILLSGKNNFWETQPKENKPIQGYWNILDEAAVSSLMEGYNPLDAKHREAMGRLLKGNDAWALVAARIAMSTTALGYPSPNGFENPLGKILPASQHSRFILRNISELSPGKQRYALVQVIGDDQVPHYELRVGGDSHYGMIRDSIHISLPYETDRKIEKQESRSETVKLIAAGMISLYMGTRTISIDGGSIGFPTTEELVRFGDSYVAIEFAQKSGLASARKILAEIIFKGLPLKVR